MEEKTFSFCPFCGAELEESNLFCTACGNEVKREIPAVTVEKNRSK